MTDPAPRRRVEPLAPPAGEFDRVVREARTRRHHQAVAVCSVTAIFLAGIVGGVALGGVSGMRDSILAVTNRSTTPPATATPTDHEETTVASVVPPGPDASTAPVPAPSTRAQSAPPEQVAAPVLHGRVVDPSGAPLAGLHVWTGTSTAAGFVPDEAAVTTDTKGRYDVPCTSAPVLVTSWEVNRALGATVTGDWAATFVDDVTCEAGAPRRVTTVEPGAVVEGQVRTDVGCPDVTFPLWLWIGGDRLAAVRLTGLREGDHYRVAGAPVGTSVLGARGRTTEVTATAGGTVEQDVTFACPLVPSTTPDPTLTPIPTPSEPSASPPSPSPSEPATSTGPGPSGSGGGSGGGGTSGSR